MPRADRQPTSPWRAVLEAHGALTRLCEQEMRADCGISLSWFDVLMHLSEADGHTMRMAELADRLLLSPSWLTRRIDGMEKAGLVRRRPAPDDRRGVYASLTPEGLDTFGQAARSHRRSIRMHFLAHLDPTEASTIESGMRRVATNARYFLKS